MSFVAFTLICVSPLAIDGDTIRCSNHAQNIRLLAVDAPELRGCRGKQGRVCVAGDGRESKRFTQGALNLGPVYVTIVGTDRYRRALGSVVTADGANLSCTLIAGGYAVARPDWDKRRMTARQCPDQFAPAS